MSAPVVGSPEWSRLVTASKAAAIIGVSPWESPYSCWMQMKGRAERPQNDAMRRGNYLEPAILAWWRDQHPGHATIAEQAWYGEGEWAGATVDAAVRDTSAPVTPLEIVEAKSAARMDDWGDPVTDVIPAYYLAQVYFQLAVTGAERCYVPVIGPYLDFSEYVVEADAAFQSDVLERCRTFYDSLEADEPPPLDSSVATYDVVKSLHPDIDKGATFTLTPAEAAEYVEACEAKKAAEERERAAKSLVLDRMARAQYADANGIRIARRQPNKHGVQLNKVAKSADLTQLEETA